MRLLATIVTLLGYVTAPNLQVSCGGVEGHTELRRDGSGLRIAEPVRIADALPNGCAELPSGNQAPPAGINFAPKPGKKPQPLDQQPQSPICYCIWKVPDERLFVRKEIRCGDVPDFFACAFLDGVYVIKR